MINPIKEKLIQEVQTEIHKQKIKQAQVDAEYRKIQNLVENKGKVIDQYA